MLYVAWSEPGSRTTGMVTCNGPKILSFLVISVITEATTPTQWSNHRAASLQLLTGDRQLQGHLLTALTGVSDGMRNEMGLGEDQVFQPKRKWRFVVRIS